MQKLHQGIYTPEFREPYKTMITDDDHKQKSGETQTKYGQIKDRLEKESQFRTNKAKMTKLNPEVAREDAVL